MKTENIKVKLRDGEMGAYIAIPDGKPAGAIIAIMEIWGVNDTMRHHAHEFAEAGFICLVPDLFWRQDPGVELSDGNPEDIKKAFDLYYDFDYDLAVRDMEDTWHYLDHVKECNGLLRHLYRAQYPGGKKPASAIHVAHGHEGPLGAGRGQ
jgi:carboxymethylenebutenolidase